MTADVTTTGAPGATIGVTGHRRRWSVSPWGAVVAWGEGAAPPLDWYVAADDRWHVPAQEPTVRQRRLDGTPVLETRLRIPDGDAVQRVWAVADAGGAVVVEFENESPKPFAVALTGPDVVTERPPADVPVQGIELDADAVVLPVGHRATVRVAIGAEGGAPSLARLAPAMAVVRGWSSVVDHASRLLLPDEALVEAVVEARCDLLLEGPTDPDDDPVGFLLDVGELVRCGDAGDPWLLEVVPPAERIVRDATGRRRRDDRPLTEVVDALAATRLVAARAGDDRAVRDVEAMAARLSSKRADDLASPVTPTSFADLRRGSSAGRFARAVERRLAADGRLLAGGVPAGWLGADFEVHHLPVALDASVSFAVRWHGERPAVLWEQHGDAIALTAPDVDASWSTTERSGEALWAAPPAARPSRPLSIGTQPDGGSFS